MSGKEVKVSVVESYKSGETRGRTENMSENTNFTRVYLLNFISRVD